MQFQRPYLPELPTTIPEFLGTAISLILSFKLNQSYDRWWEARKIWGSIVNDSRTLVRQALSFTSQKADTKRLVHSTAHQQIAWCYCLGQSLRELDWREGSVEHLSDSEIEEVQGHANKAVALLKLHARDLAMLAKRG